MKKLLLLAISLTAVLVLNAQHYQMRSSIQAETPPARYLDENTLNHAPLISMPALPQKPATTAGNPNIVTIITLGSAGNAYGFYGNGRTYLWADNNINSVSFTHRMPIPPGSGYLAYDLSTDWGWTWTNNIQVYEPTAGGQARYPQGGIYNPPGNTNYANAYYHYFSVTLDGTNGGDWGGYVHGVHKLDQTVPPTMNYLPTAPPYYHVIPNAFTINQVSGDAFVVEDAYNLGASAYTDNLILARGIFNTTINDYQYTQSLIPFPAVPGAQAWPVDMKIAFAPNGLVGYISILFDNHSAPFAANYGLYPILLKTTDGGLTWGDPFPIILSGPDGFDEVKNYLTDEQWENLWVPPAPPRDSVLFMTAFEHDLVVDMNGDFHICVTIGVASTTTPYAIIASGGYGATFHIYSKDQGACVTAQYVTHNKTFRGTFGDISEDNRSQISVSQDGSKVFLSWLDTDFEGVTDNIMPDIHAWAFDVATRTYTDVYNVTFLSEGWLEAYRGSASHYVFSSGEQHVVPFAYQTIPGGDPLNPVQFKYVADFTVTNAQFVNGPHVPQWQCNFVVLPGDANGDGVVNVLDIVTIVNYIMGLTPEPFVFANADVNGDGMINVLDVVATVNIILGGK